MAMEKEIGKNETLDLLDQQWKSKKMKPGINYRLGRPSNVNGIIRGEFLWEPPTEEVRSTEWTKCDGVVKSYALEAVPLKNWDKENDKKVMKRLRSMLEAISRN